ncbi:MAG: cytochrome B [Gammaproteobacteria bacterium]|nr:MAG: cytochrome B [Gammaproteobacteria bacterium]RLA19873.1 MAG: cytochrome B [Gammaproteobacteria bacterium]
MSNSNKNSIKVWDPLIRIFHWSLVFFFFLAFLTEDEWMTVHSYAGYSVGLLILFRLIWGVIGTRHARFSDFIRTPTQVVDYLKQVVDGKSKRYIGHNPAGAAMVVVLLISISLTTLSGIALYATEGLGPLSETFFSTWSDDILEEVHEFFANFTLFMVFLHVGGVLFSSLLHQENLIRSMITGLKQKGTSVQEISNRDPS